MAMTIAVMAGMIAFLAAWIALMVLLSRGENQ